MKCPTKVFRIHRGEIAYMKFILEGYQGLAMMRTLDPQEGVVKVYIAPGAEPEVSVILEGLSRELSLQEIEDLSTIPISDDDWGEPTLSSLQ